MRERSVLGGGRRKQVGRAKEQFLLEEDESK